jgi:two-component system sensor histidine kinase RegB
MSGTDAVARLAPSAPPDADQRRAAEAVDLAWLVTGRWTTVAAAIGAVVAGRQALEIGMPFGQIAAVVGALVLSNLWLWWRVQRAGRAVTTPAAGLLCLDVVLLTWVLLRSGGVLNPASVFFLVQIVLAALALGRRWAWLVASLAVAGYAALFLTPTDELHAAQVMHPEIAVHMRGMWIAFALTAVAIAVLVTRLAAAVERRDRALEALRERTARTARVEGLATVAAGAAHELSTPLATMAVAAHELERSVRAHGATAERLLEDVTLIRSEIARCRDILDQMAGRLAEPSGEAPRPVAVKAVVAAALESFTPAERARILVRDGDGTVVWPVGVVARALGNLLRNAVQASSPDAAIELHADTIGGQVRLRVTDRGHGMGPDDLRRAGEPFFTTKPAGAGTGLGLFVTRSSIEQLGGTLQLSSALGEGTSAVVTLPRDVLQPAEHRV